MGKKGKNSVQWKGPKYSSDTVARTMITASCEKLFLYKFSTKNNMYNVQVCIPAKPTCINKYY